MPARVCPFCRELNGEAETRCYRCGRRLPGPLQKGVGRLLSEVLGSVAPATRLVLGLELLVFGLMVAVDRRFPLWLSDGFSASTLLRFGALGGDFDAHERYRLLSAVFVHMNVMHVGMNLWMFSDLGARLERHLGGSRAVLLFIATGVLGFLASVWWYSPMTILTAGASGGVFGQIGAEVGILRAQHHPEWRRSLARNLLYALLLAVAFRVNTAAHLGGFAAGGVLGFVFERERGRVKLDRVMRVLAVLAVLGALGSVLLSAQSHAWRVERVRELMGE